VYPALNNTNKETEAIVVRTVGNQPDGAEVAEIGAIRRRVRITHP